MNRIGLLVLVIAGLASADMLGYQGKVRIQDEGGDYLVVHEHDWKSKRSSLRILNNKTKKDTTIYGVGAFTKITLNQEYGWIIMLSEIKLNNTDQMVVYDTSGNIHFNWVFRCKTLPPNTGCSESVTNYVRWFDPHSKIRVEDKVIYIKAPNGSEMYFNTK